MTLTAIEPDEYPWFDYRGHTFCLGLQDGNAAWTSGQSSSVFDPASGRMKIEGNLVQQTELSYTKLLAVLAEAGLAATDVVHVTENVTAVGIPDYADAARVRESVFGSHRPTVSTVVVDRLVRSKALIEIELHAVPAGGVELARECLLGSFTATPVREGHDGTVHLPTILPLNAEGEVVAPGDPVAQYEACLESARTTLATAGLTSEQVVACHEYVTPAATDDLATLASTRASRLGDQTVGGTVVMERLHLDSVQVALDVTASRRPQKVVGTEAPWCDDTPLVPAIRVGDALYCSAISAAEPPDDLGGQAEAVYGGLVSLLASAGLDPAALRSTIEFCAKNRIGDYKVVAGVRSELLSPPWPASTGDLSTGFGTPGALLQTVAIANYPAPSTRPSRWA